MTHESPHPARGRVVILALQRPAPDINSGAAFEIEDWADRAIGAASILDALASRSPVIHAYLLRLAGTGLAGEWESAVYGTIDRTRHIVHTSELTEIVIPVAAGAKR